MVCQKIVIQGGSFKKKKKKNFMLLFYLDLQGSDTWKELGSLNDPELQRLKSKLAGTLLQNRAPSTTRKYLYAVERWRNWAATKSEISVLPVIDYQFVLYLQSMADSTRSIAAVMEAVNAIAWLHELSCLPVVTHSPIVRSVVAGLKRALAKPKVRKAPVSIEMLKEMADDVHDPITLTESRLLSMCLLAFASFLRYDELSRLRCCDVELKEDHIVLHIQSSKTDQFRQGASVVIARSEVPGICPVVRLQEYIKLAGIDLSLSERLLRGISVSAAGEKLRKSGSLSYTRMRELVLQKFGQLGYDPSSFGLHSFRAGGATFAANAGVPDRLFKRHGRWKSETAKDGYIQDSLEARLEVTKKLKL